MTHLRGGWVIAILSGLLLIQMVSVRDANREVLLLPGPVTDSLFPSVPVRSLEGRSEIQLRQLLREHGGCTLVVVMDVSCAICQRMRIEWPRRFTAWADSIGGSVQAVWLVAESFERTKEFFGWSHSDRIIRAQITSDPDSAFQMLGVIGTPMMYLVDARGQMQLGIAGNQLPTPMSATPVCRAE